VSEGVDPVDAIANAVLYEGYILYPYRPSAIKNRMRWTFGGIFPRSYGEALSGGEPWLMQTQCLLRAEASCRLRVQVRFLHLVDRRVARLVEPGHDADLEGAHEVVESLQVGDHVVSSWQEAVERRVALDELALAGLWSRAQQVPIHLPAEVSREPLRDADGRTVAVILRRSEPIEGAIDVAAERVTGGTTRLTVRITNTTVVPNVRGLRREEAAKQALVSTHAVLRASGGGFISLADPPEDLRELAAACDNVGAWPVLVGPEGATDTLLSSPIILEDHPQVAAESPGDLFDSTEIDEILTLRILALTEEEKAEMRRADERGRLLLERTEGLGEEQLMRLHGRLRQLPRREGRAP
jgi:hypothetical protein